MGSKIYNNDEQQFEQLIKDLKGLPKEKAEDNFEYNLMVKIQNKNFDLTRPEKSSFFGRRLVPAAALAFSVIVIFFIISEPGTGLENPLLSAPPARENYSMSKVDTIELTQPSLASVPSQLNEKPEKETTQPESVVRVVVEPSDAVSIEKVDLPFDDSNSLDLDSYVKGENRTQTSTMTRGRIVSGGNSNPAFDGFLIREKASREAIEAHKARLDSLKKAQKSNKK